ncbi:hypothetical protein [Scandinavium manionii]|nr:hypothetical protein [Scandinavium manionii]MCS2150926.1 hypothetical protein [Scandinavium manionii]MCS2167146.1 hypothetical protein [Scandinavium manionii]
MLKESPEGEHHGLATVSFSDIHTASAAFTPPWETDAGAMKATFCD